MWQTHFPNTLTYYIRCYSLSFSAWMSRIVFLMSVTLYTDIQKLANRHIYAWFKQFMVSICKFVCTKVSRGAERTGKLCSLTHQGNNNNETTEPAGKPCKNNISSLHLQNIFNWTETKRMLKRTLIHILMHWYRVIEGLVLKNTTQTIHPKWTKSERNKSTWTE